MRCRAISSRPILTFAVGIHARRLKMGVMLFWSFMSLAVVIFPGVIGLRSATNANTLSVDPSPSNSMEGTIFRGPIILGSQVNGQIDDPFGVEPWTMQGSAGQRVTI